MSDLLERLIPHNKRNNHSISEAIFSIILPNKILEPERFEQLIIEGQPFHNKFQSFKILEGAQFNFQFSDENKEPLKSEFSKTGENGFQFEAYKEGKLDWLIRYQPNQAGAIFLSIHCLNYVRWDEFYENACNFLGSISSIDNGLFSNGFTLNYIDQFDWLDEELPPVDKMFNKSSKYVPSMLFETKDVWNFTSNYNRIVDKKKVTEHVNMGTQKVGHSKYNIFLLHNVACRFSEPTNLKKLCEENISLKGLARELHELNKTFLKDILVEEILTNIGIKS